MMEESNGKHHDTHAIPPQAICNTYKKYQKMSDADVDQDLEVVDFRRGLTDVQKQRIVPVDDVKSDLIASAQKGFSTSSEKGAEDGVEVENEPEACTIYEHQDFPGLRLLPNLLPPEVQIMLLDRLLHRDLSNPLHKTNIHHDYNIPYPPTASDGTSPLSFFTYPHHSKDHTFTPLNPLSKHKPLNTTQFIQKRLRWLTLGTQYDWTTRAYPASTPTPFPSDISALVTTLFRNAFTPESGVVLLYSPKDYMPVHRDVSEECQRGLASFSLGCDGLFVVARDKHEGEDEKNEEREQEMVVIRVRSGDVVQMDGETRWAWHAMPKVMGGTCPEWLEDWPVRKDGRKEFEKWRGYMKGKRLNISCRQVWG
ncbi:Alpha-ketoglutarate-dependent dioxygenase [Lachnellula occidentalis]|uniref:mRNA N(6)-methyladenine demethylase n=1 Tax=Lachnellula occidentalis TaxID=215460 RepID=A0A8H8UB31_9HELO|nr:Alpha-ketoglutarate-dependent dioxygenase [Lachnellula occidentalis]